MTQSRRTLRRAFIAAHQWGDAEVAPLKPDASHRQYLRLRRGDRSVLLMDAPPPLENVGAFAAVTRHLENLGARVPAMHALDRDHGFVLLEDLGDQTFARLLAAGHDEAALYRHAIGALGRIHQHPDATAIDLPVYGTELALAEANLLVEWYLPARLQRPLSAAAKRAFEAIWVDILTALAPLPPTLVLRDFHIDNLMLVGTPNADACALLDYQDAVLGSPAYDLASLLQDARRDLSAELVAEMMALYLAQNYAPDDERGRRNLRQHYLVWGAQRHCKVAGIFVRLWLRDRKDVSLQHRPRVMRLLRASLREPALAPLREWLDAHLGDLHHADFSAPAERLLRYCNTTGEAT